MAFISGRHVNAWSIKEAIRQLSCDLDGWCFFTEESSLLAAIGEHQGKCRFKPQMSAELIDDKWAFHEWLSSIGEHPVPSWVSADQISSYPVILKSRHSWRDAKKLPRGWCCSDEGQMLHRYNSLDERGLRKEWFFFQAYLGDGALNVSVSGYYDFEHEHRRLTVTTRKVLGNDGDLPTGVVVEVIDDPADLTERALGILRRLRYDGPFEMEFIMDPTRRDFLVLELNPRFWMQHGLFTKFADNGLVKRYVDMDGDEDWRIRVISKRAVWVNSIDTLAGVVRGDFRILRLALRYYADGAQVLFVPDWSVASGHLLKRLARKVGLNVRLDLF